MKHTSQKLSFQYTISYTINLMEVKHDMVENKKLRY